MLELKKQFGEWGALNCSEVDFNKKINRKKKYTSKKHELGLSELTW